MCCGVSPPGEASDDEDGREGDDTSEVAPFACAFVPFPGLRRAVSYSVFSDRTSRSDRDIGAVVGVPGVLAVPGPCAGLPAAGGAPVLPPPARNERVAPAPNLAARASGEGS